MRKIMAGLYYFLWVCSCLGTRTESQVLSAY